MWQNDSVWVECIVLRIVQHVSQTGCIDISKPCQAAEEVSWIMVGTKQASKMWVENRLCIFPEKKQLRHYKYLLCTYYAYTYVYLLTGYLFMLTIISFKCIFIVFHHNSRS